MISLHRHPLVSRFVADYGMVGVLAVLAVYYSWATFKQQSPTGADAARVLAQTLLASAAGETNVLIPAREGEGRINVLIAARGHEEDVRFADALAERLAQGTREGGQLHVIGKVNGSPIDIRRAVEKAAAAGSRIDVIATTTASQLVVANLKKQLPALADARIAVPEDYRWPTFLKTDNLLSVANRVVVIAIIAVGMTMVIITGGIDLSVGSLVALSAVLTAKWIVASGGLQATPATMALCCGAAIAVCGAMGGFSGLMITMFRVPPFITTLAVMQVARGLALMITRSQSITGLPRSFDWLGLDADLWSIPNAVMLMALIYVVAQFVMSRTRLGRHIYAVGGNREAARLSGIRINRVLMIVYVVCGAMAGLGGVIEASQFTSGDPKSGMMYELDVIAAVVVGGTSLAGGEGKIFGTLIGALIIAVIQNGMNLTEVEIYTQRVVLGLVILGAVLLDMLKRRGAKSDKG